MDIAGPSQPRSRGSTASIRPQSTYEDDLLHILAGLGLEGTDQFREYYDRRNRQGRQMTDHEVAMSIFLQDARDLESIEEDRALALELAQRLHLEDEVITPVIRATVPGGLNLPLPQNTPTAAVNPTRPRNNTTNGTEAWGDWLTTIFNGLFGTPQTSTRMMAPATPVPRFQQDSPPTTTSTRPTGHVCVICQDPIHGSEIQVPCGHHYDIPCITDLFQSSTRDESLYPPRCCRQNIPFSQVQPHFSRDLVTQFQEKSRELGTLNRVYCARQTCSRFLGPLTETLFGVTVYDCSAPNCGTRTCASCRGQYDGWMHTCRRDQGAEHVLNLGHTEGWSRCPGCSQLIELDMGCYHMTCRCRTEFCYLCRARWKTCRCPQWDERRLLAAAEQRVDAQLGGGGHHLRLRNVRRAELVDPLQPVQPRAPSDPVVQPRAQLVQPRALHAVPAVRTPVAVPAMRPIVPPRTPVTPRQVLPAPPVPPRTPVTLRQVLPTPPVPPRTPVTPRQVLPAPPVQPRAPAVNFLTVDTTTRRIQTQTQCLAAVQSSATSSQHQSHARSHVQVTETAQSAETSTNAHSHLRPTTGPVVPPKPSSLTRAKSSGSWLSIREQDDCRKTMTPRHSQDTDQPNTNGSTTDPSSTSTSNVGTHNDTTCQRMIRETAERLRIDHDCQHTWKYRHGEGRCENCHHTLLYLFRCVRCEMLVCNRCHRNRL
ncbi:hypothetical protein EDD17DRAFT_1197334 [Pisolithus thermaeus]|nr:hypothetical protein EDD17DRAFT_1197334 [Pisolithus thermaeus]